MKSKKCFIAFMLFIVFLMLSTMPILAVDTQAAYAKISDDLLAAFENTEERLDVIVWLEDESIDEYQSIVSNIPEPEFASSVNESAEYSIQTASETGLSYEERMVQIEQMQNYIMQKRQIAQAVYLEDNNAVAKDLEAELDGGEIIYISRYSSLIICSMNQSEAVDIAMNSCVTRLTYESETEVSNLQYSLPLTGATNAVTPQYSADGIIIGMIELSIPDVSRPCFDGVRNKIETMGATNSYEVGHASFVAAIITNAAPGFEKLLCVGYTGNSSIYSEIENLLSQGVNVINMSMGWMTNPIDSHINAYDERSLWFDHIAYNHSVHFVNSAGNYGTDKVASPGMAYNIITVGNCNDKNSSNPSNTVLASNTAYNSSYDDLAYKPDLCAPGASIDIPNDSGFIGYNADKTTFDLETQGSGTSSSAPHVTAIVAALCSYYPQLLTKQSLMKSILMTSVSTATSNNYSTMLNQNGEVSIGFRQWGSGIVNAYNAKSVIDSESFINGSITSSENEDVISIGTLEKGQTVVITLVFLKRARFTSSLHTSTESGFSDSDLADLDLYICPAPTYVANACTRNSAHYKSITPNNNVEKIIVTANNTAEYLICIDKYEGHGTYDIIYAASWMVIDDDSK